MAGAYLAVGSFSSALSRSQVIGFIIAVVLCLFFVLAGWPPVTNALSEWAPPFVVSLVAGLGFMPHYDAIQRGIIDSRDLVYFGSFIGFMLVANAALLNLRRAS
jgi:ABC-2 type transport system permease protein